MRISEVEKMNVLLEQLQIPENYREEYFQESRLTKLKVYKESKTWHFYIALKQVLPLHIYRLFTANLKHTFQQVDHVHLTIETEDKTTDEENVSAYWRDFLQSGASLSPAYQDLVHNQTPKVNDNKIMLTARNEAEKNALIKRLQSDFQVYCQNTGLPAYQFDINIKLDESDIQKFKEQKALEDREMILKTVKQKEENELKKVQNNNQPLMLGYKIQDDPFLMEEIQEEERRITVQGYIFDAEIRELRSGRSLLIIKATDYTDSLQIKMFSRGDEDAEKFKSVKEGMWIKARGSIQTDMYTNELAMMANDIHEIKVKTRKDEAPEDEKRVELHAHTTMSQLDAVVSPSNLIAQAKKWGHSAVAITDHAGVQGFPEAHAAGEKNDIKVLYGVEANLVDDGVPIAYNEQNIDLKTGTHVVFDVETTGLSAVYDTIIELAGVKIQDGEVIDRFESFANPHHPLSQTTTDLTGITDDMVKDAPEVDEVLKNFHEWTGDSVLVAHNASFDIGFLNQGYKKLSYKTVQNAVIDTLELARFLFPELKNHRLNTLCKYLDIELTQHHRAIYDAEATGYLFWKLVKELLNKDITNHNQLNNHMGEGNAYQRSRPFHCILLAQTEIGLKNIYKLVSSAHIDYFYRVPRIPRSLLQKMREGILIGSACDQGEVFETMMQKSAEEAENAAAFYDYIEVQPPANYAHLIEKDLVQNEAQILDIIRKLVEMGGRMDKPVVATGNVHYIEDHDKLYRPPC
jgi:DNA polymerase-3 subunit alpha (Gram-positive type)